MSHKPSKQAEEVLTMLRRRSKRGITPLDAFPKGITRLAARVWELREAGYDITTETVEGDNGAKYARYHLNE